MDTKFLENRGLDIEIFEDRGVDMDMAWNRCPPNSASEVPIEILLIEKNQGLQSFLSKWIIQS